MFCSVCFVWNLFASVCICYSTKQHYQLVSIIFVITLLYFIFSFIVEWITFDFFLSFFLFFCLCLDVRPHLSFHLVQCAQTAYMQVIWLFCHRICKRIRDIYIFVYYRRILTDKHMKHLQIGLEMVKLCKSFVHCRDDYTHSYSF